MIAATLDPIPTRDEMRGLLAHVRMGQPEATTRWVRGAVYHHALKTGAIEPAVRAGEAGLWSAAAVIAGIAGWYGVAALLVALGLWRLRAPVRRSEFEAREIAMTAAQVIRVRVETV